MPHLKRTVYAKDINESMIDSTVTVSGWVHKSRNLGQICFLHLRDISGTIQITAVKGDTSDEVFESLASIPRESVITVMGKTVPSQQKNASVEISPLEISIESISKTPLPMGVADKVNTELDTRLDSRFIDLRKPEVAAIFKIRSAVSESIKNTLLQNRFIEVNTPKIVATATEGGTNLFPIKYFDTEAYMNQSPQLFKQMLMASGLDRVFEFGPAFRMEKHDTVRHINEFTSIDIEMSFSDEEGAMQMLELAIRNVYRDLLAGCKDEIELIRSHIDSLNRVIEAENIQVRRENKKIKSDNKSRKAEERLPFLPEKEKIPYPVLEVPSIPLPRVTYSEALEIANAELQEKAPWGEDLNMEATKIIAKKYPGLYFITEWPTEIKPFYVMPFENNEKVSRSFDLMFAEKEITSGAQRIHNADMLVESLKSKGLDPAPFDFYIRAFEYGMPPHAGWGLGMERMMMMLTGLNNVRECVLFPRDRWRLVP